ncbi:hypothetical protein [Halodesulfovibrio sp.]|jgi:ElaB/YqjD/DUF883 family membrane-anchored ribosome-binding protein|uniref:hypothetical protein n=1 Tax=Halodesulfovibrio sp. TaxID=1912772 RepID=UPI0025FCF85C|nr:hypothetical protein [Halodesulfovibrio sp.]MCT4628012.1 hypothetical protein [Halodesulfovibrio sp.]
MSKTDQMKSMVLDRAREYNEARKAMTPEEEQQKEDIEGLLEVIGKLEHYKASSYGETMALLKHLRTTINQAANKVEKSAEQVKDFPVSVIARVTSDITQAGRNVEQSAKRASMLLDDVRDYALEVRKSTLWSGVGLGVLIGMLLVIVMRIVVARYLA